MKFMPYYFACSSFERDLPVYLVRSAVYFNCEKKKKKTNIKGSSKSC